MEESVLWKFVFASMVSGALALGFIGASWNQRLLVDEKNNDFEYTLCPTRTITVIESPPLGGSGGGELKQACYYYYQNISNHATQESCFYYKHLQTEFTLGPKAEVDGNLVAAAVIFTFICALLVGMICVKNR